DLVVLDLVGELAADAAIGADAVDRTVGLAQIDIVLVDHRRRHQRAGRAGLHAPADGEAGRATMGVVKVEQLLLEWPAARHADDVVDLDLAAGADAQVALDAGVEIDRHRDVAAIGRRHGGSFALGEAAGLELLALDDLPQLRIRIARDLDGGLIGEQELGDHIARRLGAVGLGLDLHAGRRRADAARGEHALALDLDHADAAVAVRAIAGLGRIAQVRQLDVEPAGGAEDRLALADVDLAVVDEERLGGRLAGLAHPSVLSITNGPTAWWVHQESISRHTLRGSRRPGRAHRSTHRASAGTVRSGGRRSTAPAPSASPPSRCRRGTACTGRSSRPRRTSSG